MWSMGGMWTMGAKAEEKPKLRRVQITLTTLTTFSELTTFSIDRFYAHNFRDLASDGFLDACTQGHF
jgi:hypothetical protein